MKCGEGIKIPDLGQDRRLCKPDDDLRKALATTAQAGVRRLPATDATRKLEGLLSIDDMVLHTETAGIKKDAELTAEDVVNALKSVYRSPGEQASSSLLRPGNRNPVGYAHSFRLLTLSSGALSDRRRERRTIHRSRTACCTTASEDKYLKEWRKKGRCNQPLSG